MKREGVASGGTIAVLGEALIDLVGERDARTFRAHPGGSPANVAVGLARLGTPVTMLGRLAEDAFGQQLRRHLASAGVNLDHAVRAGEPSSLAVAALGPTGDATFDFWVNGTADWAWRAGELPDPLPDSVVAIHTGSLALALEPGAHVAEAFLSRVRGSVTISFDPNLRPGLMGEANATRERVERQVRLAHIVKVSAGDLAFSHPSEAYVDVAARWLQTGPSLVVVTLGERGAYAATRSERVELDAVPVDVVDTVGAGDAFTAGLLTGLRERGLLGSRPLEGISDRRALCEILSRALLVAALTCTRAGARPPGEEELSAFG